MKRTFLALAAFVGIAASAHAASVFSDTFSYGDGALDAVSGGVWYQHSGTVGQLQVAGGQVLLGGSNSEDVSAYITNSTFTTPFKTGPGAGSLYASFTINMSTTLPTGGGTYFFHFRDTGTFNFRARTWASNTGAAPGNYRIGIAASSGTPVYIPLDITNGETHTIVVKWNMEQTNATVWVDPVKESSTIRQAVSTDTSGDFSAYNVSLREGSSSTGAGLMNFDNLKVGTAFLDVYTPSGPPSIGPIANQSIPRNGTTGPVPFTVDSPVYDPATLTLSGTSDNTTLVPDNPANISFGGSGMDRTVTITPATGQQGQAVISVVATDSANLKATNNFLVKVGAPGFATSIANQLTPTNTPTAAIPFTLTDAEGDSLTVTATSSNPTVVANTDIVVSPATSTSLSRTVQITPQPDKAGVTTITLTVSDGFNSATTSFVLTVYQHLGALLLGDTFTYPDGEINASSGGFWQAHSAQLSNDCLVVNNQLRVASTNYEDVNAGFTNSVYMVATGDSSPPYYFSGVILYSRFTVNFQTLPTSSGDYFAHFKDLGTSNFRARVFARTSGAAPGKFRLGISNGGFTVAAVPRDLSLNTTYVVVTRYNVSTAESAIWVNPHSEASAIVGASAADLTSPVEIDKYCFRQGGSTAGGNVLVDDLQIGTAFTDVLPAITPPSPTTLTITTSGGNAVVSWSDGLFTLQSAPTVNGPWTTLWDATSGYSTPLTPAQQFFRAFYYQ